MSEEELSMITSALYGADRAVAGLLNAFDADEGYLREHDIEADTWFYEHYEATAGTLRMVAALLERLTRGMLDGDCELVRKGGRGNGRP